MNSNWNYDLRMVASLIVIFMSLILAISAEEVVDVSDAKETASTSQNLPDQEEEHTVAKRAWNQLQSGWGKRSFDDGQRESFEELKRKLLKLYSEQLLSNQADENEYGSEESSAPMDKRAWKSMGTAWGKRDWSQLRGNGWGKRETGNWNNMRGLWGKRSPGWNKLSSAWGK